MGYEEWNNYVYIGDELVGYCKIDDDNDNDNDNDNDDGDTNNNPRDTRTSKGDNKIIIRYKFVITSLIRCTHQMVLNFYNKEFNHRYNNTNPHKFHNKNNKNRQKYEKQQQRNIIIGSNILEKE